MSDADLIDQGWGAHAAKGSGEGARLWQVNTRGRKVVEMTEPELGASLKAGKLSARSLVWAEGMAEWSPLGEVTELARLLRESEPPASGTRPRLDELTGNAGLYAAVADTTTTGLAVYERPLAVLEFPEELDARDVVEEPALPAPPPMPSMRATLPGPLFPEPVFASPLAAALSTAKAPSDAPPANADAPAHGAGNATATADAPAKPPRPAVEFLPPIIVHEKEDDDGASAIINLPLGKDWQEAPTTETVTVEMPRVEVRPAELPRVELHPAPYSEATLVLAGRRRPRWIPLNAAIALGIGTACLASALTAVAIRTRPSSPRVIEKIVTVPVVESRAQTEGTHTPASSAGETDAHPVAATASDATRAKTPNENAVAKADATKVASNTSAVGAHPREGARHEDPSGLADEPKPTQRLRAGFPTNPGF
jgi:hypothetical protein